MTSIAASAAAISLKLLRKYLSGNLYRIADHVHAATAIEPRIYTEEDFYCVITMDLMKNAHSTPCGHNFSYVELCAWVNEHKNCPLCRTKIENINQLKFNQSLQSQIDAFVEEMFAVPLSPPTPPLLFTNKTQNVNADRRLSWKLPQVQTNHPQTVRIVTNTIEVKNITTVAQKNVRKFILEPETRTAIQQILSYQYSMLLNTNANIATSFITMSSGIFTKLQIPLGLLKHIIELRDSTAHFVIDDSDSMMSLKAEAYKKKRHNRSMSRWSVVEFHLHNIIDLLAYIPNIVIKVSFLYRRDVLNIERRRKNPIEFATDAHNLISNIFEYYPQGGTPCRHALHQISHPSAKERFFLFTDNLISIFMQEGLNKTFSQSIIPGQYNFVQIFEDGSKQLQLDEILNRMPKVNVITEYCEAKNNFMHRQGIGIPYSYGMWLTQLLCFNRLQQLSSSDVFSQSELSKLIGIKLTVEEYNRYKLLHPRQMQNNLRLVNI